MQNIIYKSKNIIPWDTQSAFKMTSYNCHSEENMVFCYLKGYVKNGDLILCSYCFVKEPTGTSDLSLYLNLNPAKTNTVLSIDFGFDGISKISISGKTIPEIEIGTIVDYSPFKANDEQGFYWCGQIVIPKENINKIFSTSLEEKSIISLNMVQNFTCGDFSTLCGDATAKGYSPEENMGNFLILNY